jgi:SAM-dependent methyltransferase
MDFTGSFDLIYSHTTFHHLNVPHVLEKCKNMLAPGGVLYIIDNVSKRPTPPTLTYIIGAIMEYQGNHQRYGSQDAKRIFRHSVSSNWLAHLSSDRYLSEADYHSVYGSILHGCELIYGGWNMKVIWKNYKSY